jgi:hypothetical protein
MLTLRRLKTETSNDARRMVEHEREVRTLVLGCTTQSRTSRTTPLTAHKCPRKAPSLTGLERGIAIDVRKSGE